MTNASAGQYWQTNKLTSITSIQRGAVAAHSHDDAAFGFFHEARHVHLRHEALPHLLLRHETQRSHETELDYVAVMAAKAANNAFVGNLVVAELTQVFVAPHDVFDFRRRVNLVRVAVAQQR